MTETETYITLHCEERTEDGDIASEVTINLTGDDAMFLPNILAGIRHFLQAMTFTYVHTVEAHSNDKTFSSEDI